MLAHPVDNKVNMEYPTHNLLIINQIIIYFRRVSTIRCGKVDLSRDYDIASFFTRLLNSFDLFRKANTNMARCTAPVHGHRTASAAAACPACNSRKYRSSYESYSYPSYAASGGSSGNRSTIGSNSRSTKPHWSKPSSSVLFALLVGVPTIGVRKKREWIYLVTGGFKQRVVDIL